MNQVKDRRSFPGADVETDHNLVIMKGVLKFKKLEKKVPTTTDRKVEG